MKRGFIFMLDAFIALLVVLAFVSTLSSFNRDYAYVQDEILYSHGRNIMDVLLYTTVEIEGRGEVPLIHALKLDEGRIYWNANIKPLIPENVNYSIEYYDGVNEKWISFGSTYDTLQSDYSYYKSVAVISSIPIITRNEQYKAPYTYSGNGDNMCAESLWDTSSEEGEGSAGGKEPYKNVCSLGDRIYTPDIFNGNSSIETDDLIIGFSDNWEQTENYQGSFVRILVKV